VLQRLDRLGRLPHPGSRRTLTVIGIRGDDYDLPFLERERAGFDVHGEARLVSSFAPHSVLDAGCGTGRVAIELDSRGITVAGIDADPEMLATARRKAPDLEWIDGDLTAADLRDRTGERREFDLVVMAGNVMIFLVPGTEPAAVGNLARHLAPGGVLIAGFQFRAGGLTEIAYEELCRTAGLAVEERWAGWAREPWEEDCGYLVSVARR
jgi:SAM-dependent methyltransferase